MKLNISYPANGSQKLFDIGMLNPCGVRWLQEVTY
jgi:hypothetical protein